MMIACRRPLAAIHGLRGTGASLHNGTLAAIHGLRGTGASLHNGTLAAE